MINKMVLLPSISYQYSPTKDLLPRRFKGSHWSPTDWMSQASYVACLQRQFQFKVGHLTLPLLKQRPFPFDDGGMPDPPGTLYTILNIKYPKTTSGCVMWIL
ncbi:hypothetical protein FRC02_005228 [Tulasnella sp. 418]|nr:hypothetical protein FRC02_005228 [Tulasnella sp. 418]